MVPELRVADLPRLVVVENLHKYVDVLLRRMQVHFCQHIVQVLLVYVTSSGLVELDEGGVQEVFLLCDENLELFVVDLAVVVPAEGLRG